MMRLFVLTAFLLIRLTGYAECGEGSLEFWPVTATIRQNPVIVIDGNGSYGRCITSGLGTYYRVFLQSGDEKINLQVQETLTGHYDRMQVVLKPKKGLTDGQEYELIIEIVNPVDSTSRYCTEWLAGSKRPKWKVVAGMDTEAPRWISKPIFKDEYFEKMGCGNTVYANFKFAAADSSTYLVKASIKSLQSGNITTCLLRPQNNTISIGHGMCCGPFAFADGKDYEVTFGLMDASGNQVALTTCAIPFTRPKARFNITGNKQ
jgi:hypothetical protein